MPLTHADSCSRPGMSGLKSVPLFIRIWISDLLLLHFRSWDNDREDKLSKVKSLSRLQSNSLGDLSRNSSERVFIAKVLCRDFSQIRSGHLSRIIVRLPTAAL